MNGAQKLVAVLALAVVAAMTLRAPYAYHARYDYSEGELDGLAHAPLWSPPAAADIGLDVTIARGRPVSVEDVRLDAGRLGLWWALVALTAGVVMVLAAPARRS